MRHFIIDGYNALFKIKPLVKKPFQTREGFIHYLRIKKPFGSMRNKVTVVFDGSLNVSFKQKTSNAPIEVIFTRNETADDMIIRMAKNAKYPRAIIVITDDREIKEKVKLYGCATLSVLEFFKDLTREKKPKEKDKPEPGSKEGRDITEELKKIWGITSRTSEEDKP